VKYKAKATIDTFFVRAGDAISAIVVALGIHQFGFAARELAFVNVALIIVWMGIAFAIAHAHRLLQREQPEPRPMRRTSGMIYYSTPRSRRPGPSSG
jgi:AAA family ATP:ADP antiporter